MKTHKSIYGFTLTELMIVIAIIAILGAIAFPGYQRYVTKTHRTDAQKNLLELTQYMERYFTENGRYHQDAGGTAVSLPFSKSPKDGTTTHYNIAFATGTLNATAYTLLATPIGSQLANDTDCGILSLTSTDVKCILNQTKCSNSATASVRSEVGACW